MKKDIFLIIALVSFVPWGIAQTDDGWDDAAWDEAFNDAEATGKGALPITGFFEGAWGLRTDSSDYHDRLTLGESRLRLETGHTWKGISLAAKADAWHDAVVPAWHAQVRELSLQSSIASRFDVKAGRQIITWGTGDYLFLNDLFPKDWQSFFIGRDDEYLKAPSDAVKLSGYFSWLNVNLVWTPEFDPDTFIRGERLSLFSPWASGMLGEPGFDTDTPDGDEWAVRLYRTLGSTELAIYGYDGYFKNPQGISSGGYPTFPRLRTYGASLRSPLGNGLFNAELAQHKSLDDRDGSNPNIPNNQWRFLLGYERELLTRVTGSFQAYLEHTQHHQALLTSSPFMQWEPARNRTIWTTRITWRSQRDDLTLSIFSFHSPSDDDGYLRPSVDYRFNDHWSASGGFNVFFGKHSHSFFSQFEDNNNAYARVRYSF